MREIVLDTETTGFGVEDHRIIEIGCVEMVGKIPTGRTFHHYCNPERPIDFGSTKVHGITDDKVADAPKFREIAAAFLEFMGDSPLVAHNAEFDVSFLNAELARAGFPALVCEVIDTLAIAKQKLPGQRHNLDALCRHFNVDNSARTYHGALLDALLLADVYVELSGGLQATLELASETVATVVQAVAGGGCARVVVASAEEVAAHGEFLASQVPNALWLKAGE